MIEVSLLLFSLFHSDDDICIQSEDYSSPQCYSDLADAIGKSPVGDVTITISSSATLPSPFDYDDTVYVGYKATN